MTTDIIATEDQTLTTQNFDVKAAIMTAFDTTAVEGQKRLFNGATNAMSLDEFIAQVKDEIANKTFNV